MLTYWETLIATRSNIAVSDSYAALWGKKAQNNYTVETYTGALPVTLEGTVAGYLESYKIWGNTGGVGVKKTNLAEGEQLLRNASMGPDGTIVTTSSNFAFRLIPVVEGREYTIINIYGGETSMASNFYAFFEELPQIGSVSYDGHRYSFKTPSRTFVAPITGYLAISDYYPMYDEQHSNLIPLEVYEGNESPYYLPIVSAITGLSEPLCAIDKYADSLDLSTSVLTRRIKKLELTGNENFIVKDSGSDSSNYMYQLIVHHERTLCVCSHLPHTNSYPRSFMGVRANASYYIIYINIGTDSQEAQPSGNTVAGFKEYLAAQYAAGTPVTIWYVLAEPETSTVPVPSGLTGTIEGYLIQDGTPTPENPIYPSANDVMLANASIYIGRTTLGKNEYVDSESGKIYRMVDGALTPTDPPVPLPQIPTSAGTTTISYGGTGAQPEKVEFKYQVKR